jgi:hypothetical protein
LIALSTFSGPALCAKIQPCPEEGGYDILVGQRLISSTSCSASIFSAGGHPDCFWRFRGCAFFRNAQVREFLAFAIAFPV